MPGALRSIWWFLSIPVTLVLLVVGYASLVSGNLIRAAYDNCRNYDWILVYIRGDHSGKNKPVSILRCGWGRSDTEKFSILFSSRRNVSGTLKPGVNTTWSVNQGKKIPGFSEIHFQKSECAFLPAACFCLKRRSGMHSAILSGLPFLCRTIVVWIKNQFGSSVILQIRFLSPPPHFHPANRVPYR